MATTITAEIAEIAGIAESTYSAIPALIVVS
jgi:hypothetical protein